MEQLTELLGQLNMEKLQGPAEELKKKIGAIRIKKEAGGGLISVEIDGHKKVLDICIEDSLMNIDEKEVLQDLIVAAINLATEEAEEKVKKLTIEGTMSMLPNLMNHSS